MPVGGPPTPTAVAKPPVPKDSGRRNFIKALFAIGAILSIAPFVPWGTFLSSSVSTGNAKRTLLQKVVIDDVQKYGAAAGKEVNVNDIATFPPNSHWVITYPSSGDLTIDAQDPDTFLKYELIRLPTALGGGDKKATDFVAFSKVCVHLWCSPNYNPSAGHQQYECPCHGSIYEVPDGKAVQGPASLQPAPTNAIPMLTLQADSTGALYVVYPNRDPTKPLGSDMVNSIEGNGELGYGRDYNSYQSFVRQLGQVPADPKGLTQEIA
jgi:Rieske Fe-S protein